MSPSGIVRLCIDTIRTLAPIKALLAKFGFTPAQIVEVAHQQIAKYAR